MSADDEYADNDDAAPGLAEEMPRPVIQRRKTNLLMKVPLIERRKTTGPGTISPATMAQLAQLGSDAHPDSDDEYAAADGDEQDEKNPGPPAVAIPRVSTARSTASEYSANDPSSGPAPAVSIPRGSTARSGASEYSANDPTPRAAPAACFDNYPVTRTQTDRYTREVNLQDVQSPGGTMNPAASFGYDNNDGSSQSAPPDASSPSTMPPLEVVAMPTLSRTKTDQFKNSYDIQNAVADAQAAEADEYAAADGGPVPEKTSAPPAAGDGGGDPGMAMPSLGRTKTDHFLEEYAKPLDLDAHFGAEPPSGMMAEDSGSDGNAAEAEPEAQGRAQPSLLNRQTTDKFKNEYESLET